MKTKLNQRPAFKVFLTVVLITLLAGVSNKVNAQIKAGIQGGYTISNVLMKDMDGKRNPSQSLPGFHIGINADIPVAKNFYIQPVFEYIVKGFKQKNNAFFGSGNETKVKADYLQLPVNFIYEFNAQKGRLYLGAGPYAAYGIGGKWKAKSDVLIGDIRIKDQGKVNFRDDLMEGNFGEYTYGKPWEFGASLLLGYRFTNQLSVQVNDQMGINNLHANAGNASSKDAVIKNRTWNFSLGYRF